MIVPRHWAESRLRERVRGRQVTLRRFGWSNLSEADAQAMADQRVREAMAQVQAGRKVAQRERKQPYNGAQGLPIREEIVEEHGDAVITRNSYGARCLNTPNVLFGDIDLDAEPSGGLQLAVYAGCALAGGVVGWGGWSFGMGVALAIASLFVGSLAVSMLRRWTQLHRPRAEAKALARIERFVAADPQWQLRVYRTPSGLRVLALHRLFDPREPAVAQCFKAWGVDPLYALMCANQRCFRARLSAKPWRAGIGRHMRPRPGVWPVQPERLPERRQWIEHYEQVSARFAACSFVRSVGSGSADPVALGVQALHDRLSRALEALPIA